MSEADSNQQDNKINQYDKLIVDISNNLTTRLSDLMSKLLNSAQEKLFTLSDEADNNEDQTRYFELMNQVRNLKPEVARVFDRKIKEYLVPAKDFESKQQEQSDDLEGELSLVGQDEMEGIVLVKGIGERAAGRYREQLSHLEARLEHLALKTPNTFKKDALQPTNFCQAFDDALADHFDNTNKKILFGMFDIEVANKLDALYDSINNRLIDADILPQIKLHVQGQKAKGPRPKPTPPPGQEAEQAQEYSDDGFSGGYGGASSGTSGYAGSAGAGSAGGGAGSQAGGAAASGGSNISGFAMTAAPGSSYRHSDQSSLQAQAEGEASGAQGQHGGAAGGGQGGSNVGGSNMGGGQQGNPNADLPGGHTPEGAAEYQHYTAGMPANQVGRVLGNYIGGAPLSPETAKSTSKNQGEFFPESTPQHFGHQEILQALSHIQSQPQFDQPTETRFDGEAIKQAVLAEIAKTSGGAVTKRINQIAEKTIDFIELIFDAIIDDDDISDTIKALLLRLQIPIIKASMTDQEFFIYDDHPARMLLDSIADAGVGITDHTDDTYKHLDRIVTNILGEFELSTETFQAALDLSLIHI